MKKLLWLLAAAAALFTVFVMPGIGQDIADRKFEGDGFDTPEEAVAAFVDAFSRNDTEAALFTFAIESMVDSREAMGQIRRFGSFLPYNSFYTVPNENDWIRGIKIVKRYAEAADYLYKQYVTFTIADGIDMGQTNTLTIRTESELDSFIGVLQRPERQEFLGNISFVDCLDPVSAGFFSDSRFWKSYTQQGESYAAEDFMPLAAHIRVGNRHGLIFFDCGRYGGRWYNLALGGLLSYQVGLDSYQSGTVVMSTEEYIYTIAQYVREADPDIKALYNAHLKSELNGTAWKLTEVTGSPEEIVAAKSYEDLKNFGEKPAAWAQVRFTRWGFSMEMLTTPIDPDARLNRKTYGNWLETDGILTMEGLEDNTVVLSGGKLMITLEGGITAVFEREQN